MRELTIGDATRTFIVHIPTDLAKTQAVPLVFVHHGFTMSGMAMQEITSFQAVADREGFVVAFPDGGGSSPWNVGQGVCSPGDAVSAPESQDDFGFVAAMVEDIKADQCVNQDRIYTTGFSMGGYFSNHMGCKGGIPRAIAPHSGGTYTGSCDQGHIPVMLIHGDSDTLISLDCGEGAREQWVQRNGCSSEVESKPIKGGTCEWHKNCPADGQVVMCVLEGMDHGWAGAEGSGRWLLGDFGGGENYENAAEMIWSFFKTYE